MNFSFANGTEEQRAVVEGAFDLLLDLDLDRFDIDITFRFVSDPSQDYKGHERGVTEETGNGSAEIRLRNDFPAFEPVELYGATEYANQTVVHELGHALFNILSADTIARLESLFGFDAGALAEYDDSIEWVDRPWEGVAETFKDAFLPPRHRPEPNRTNIKIPIHKYPEFRALWRGPLEVSAGVPGGGGGGDGLDVPAYDADLVRSVSPGSSTPIYDPTNTQVVGQGLSGSGLEDYQEISWDQDNIVAPRQYVARSDSGVPDVIGPSTAGFLIEPGTVLEATFRWPDLDFFEVPAERGGWSQQVQDASWADSAPGQVLGGVDDDPILAIQAINVCRKIGGHWVAIDDGLTDFSGAFATSYPRPAGTYAMVTHYPDWPDTDDYEYVLLRSGVCEGVGPGHTSVHSWTIEDGPDAVEACGDRLIPIRVFGAIQFSSFINDSAGLTIPDYHETWVPSMPFEQEAHPACSQIPAQQGGPGVSPLGLKPRGGPLRQEKVKGSGSNSRSAVTGSHI